jgi:hypothetical protein
MNTEGSGTRETGNDVVWVWGWVVVVATCVHVGVCAHKLVV